jgi:predicted phosphodiesterase
MRIGVIGHTQQLKTVEDLPPRAQLALAEMDLVLHVGNVGSLTFLRAIQDKFGLTFAVCSSQDSDEVKRYLEAEKVVEFANRRIGMIFETTGLEQVLTLAVLKKPHLTPASLSEQLISEFEDVDCVVFGYPPKPFNYVHNGILVFNPGPLINVDDTAGTMGILEITERVITGRVVPL